METALVTNSLEVQQPKRYLVDAGIVANHVGGSYTFADYMNRKSKNTLRAQLSDLQSFINYLSEVGVSDCPTAEELQNRPEAWLGVTWGLVQGFVKWLLDKGFAVSSVNRKLYTVKAYAELAAKAGTLDRHELMMIDSVTGFAKKEFNRVDEKREVSRLGDKKGSSTVITPEQAKALKTQPDTPQGRRDAVIMCLLLDHGLRVGELSGLLVTNINLQTGEIIFFRDKVQKQQTHRMTPDTRKVIIAYTDAGDIPAMGYLLRGSNKTGALTADGMTERSITRRVGELGRRAGVENLSAHDCRHYWATRATRKGTDPFALLQAGGWTSMTTVKKYVDESEIANDGVIL